MANNINFHFADAEIIVIGRHWEKVRYSFAKELYITDSIPGILALTMVSECCGGDGCGPAIVSIPLLNHKGTILMMSVGSIRLISILVIHWKKTCY